MGKLWTRGKFEEGSLTVENVIEKFEKILKQAIIIAD
jgi:hypothetical protein